MECQSSLSIICNSQWIIMRFTSICNMAAWRQLSTKQRTQNKSRQPLHTLIIVNVPLRARTPDLWRPLCTCADGWLLAASHLSQTTCVSGKSTHPEACWSSLSRHPQSQHTAPCLSALHTTQHRSSSDTDSNKVSNNLLIHDILHVCSHVFMQQPFILLDLKLPNMAS